MKYVVTRVVLLYVLTLFLSGCEYRLTAPIPPSRELVRIKADRPEQYKVEMKTEKLQTFDVPPDGRLSFDIPPYRAGCGPYLFGVINVGGNGDPLKSWAVSIKSQGKTVRQLSVRSLLRLPTDSDGYHVVKIG